MADHSEMYLGKLPPKIDPRTLKLARYLIPTALPPLPAARDWTEKALAPWGMMLNDRLGDCTCAATGHAVQVWTANETKEYTIPDKAILKAYQDVGGYVPGNESTDNGAYALDLLNYWRQTGVGGHKIYAFAAVDLKNHTLVKQAINLMGGLYIGINLPITAQTQDYWHCVGYYTGKAKPGSWGGHAVQVVGYSNYRLRFITWGKEMTMTWCFWDHYVDEAYAVLSSQDWVTISPAPSGFNLAQLQADLAQL